MNEYHTLYSFSFPLDFILDQEYQSELPLRYSPFCLLGFSFIHLARHPWFDLIASMTDIPQDFSFRPLTLDELRQVHPPFLNDEQWLSHFTRKEVSDSMTFSATRTWEHTLSPFRLHHSCMNKHIIITFDVPMIEAQFLLICPQYRVINPQTRVGFIHLRLCPRLGTRVRLELMDMAIDVDVPFVAQIYSVVSGPSLNGYIVAVFLRGTPYSRMVIFHAHSDLEGNIHYDFLEYENQPWVTNAQPPLLSSSGGVCASRHSW